MDLDQKMGERLQALCHQIDDARRSIAVRTETAQVDNPGGVFDRAETSEVNQTEAR